MKFMVSFRLCLALLGAVGCASQTSDRPSAVAAASESQAEPQQQPQLVAISPTEAEPAASAPDVPEIPSADTDTWKLAEGVVGGRVTLIRFRPGLSKFLAHPSYPRRLTIAWSYGDDGKSGLPTPEQAETLKAFEDRLVPALEFGRVAVLAFVYTSRGVREWNYYVSDVRAADLRINAALRDEPGLPIQLEATDDPGWEEFKALLEGVKSDD